MIEPFSVKASPKRIRKRNFYDYSWKKNPNAVYVGRPTKWGNPFKVSEYGLDECLKLYSVWLVKQLYKNPKFLDPLRGKDLVCFCNLDEPCHADILLKVSNREVEGKQ